MFNCVVSQSLSAINSAAVSIKIISTDLWVFLNQLKYNLKHLVDFKGMPPINSRM
jgi:hypothetical protein